MEDPFFVVKDEVFKALNKTRGLYLRWRELDEGAASPELEWTTTELRNSLRSIEWDLEDLEDTITIFLSLPETRIVEKNPNKFKIDKRELSTRRTFIQATRDEVQQMKERMSLNRVRGDRDITARQPLLDNSESLSHSIHINNLNNINSNGPALGTTGVGIMSGSGFRHGSTKYSKLENEQDSPSHHRGGGTGLLDSPTTRFMGQTMSMQQQMFHSQDDQLDVMSDSIGTLKTVSRQINQELDEHAVMLDDFGHELGNTESKLDSTMKKMAKLMHVTNDKRQWMTIGILTALLVILIIIIFVF